MQIIAPTWITDTTLIASDIPAESVEYPEWSSTYSYVTGQRCSVNYLIDGTTPGVHKIYECLWHAPDNLNHYPPDHVSGVAPILWSRISATNRWKLFDMIVAPDRATVGTTVSASVWGAGTVWETGTKWDSSSYSSMMVTILPGEIDTAALMNVDSTSIRFVMTDPSAGEVYNETKIPSVTTAYNAIYSDLPAYPNATLQVNVRNTGGSVAAGELIVGKAKDIGKALYGLGVGLVDYSAKEADAFGNFTILERAFSKRMDVNFTMPIATHSGILRLLEKYRSVPLVWIVSDLYSTTIAYGFYRDLKVTVSNPSFASGSLSIEGLGADYVHSTVTPDPWVPVWDGIIDLVVPGVPTVSVSTSKIEEAPTHVDTVAMSVPAVPTVAATTGVYVLIGTCSISYASPAIITCAGHGLADHAPLFFQTDGAIPDPLEPGDYKTNVYYVVEIGLDTFSVSLTAGGSPIDTTNAGSGTHKLMNGTPS
jgi:hypothetical protein